MKKKTILKNLSMFLSLILLIALSPMGTVNANHENRTDLKNQIGSFNKETISLYKNPMESMDEKIELSKELLPEKVLIQHHLVDDHELEWYQLDADSFDLFQEYGYVSIEDVDLKEEAINENITSQEEIRIEEGLDVEGTEHITSEKKSETDEIQSSEESNKNHSNDFHELSETKKSASQELLRDLESATGSAITFINPGPIMAKKEESLGEGMISSASLKNSNLARNSDAPVHEPLKLKGLELNKGVEKIGDDYEITLEAFSTGSVTVTEETKPMDVILVLDQSGSMAYGFKGRNGPATPIRLDSLISSVKAFVNKIETNARNNEVDHRVAIVGFSSAGDRNSPFQNTELLTGVDVSKGAEKNPNKYIGSGTPFYYPKSYAYKGAQYYSHKDNGWLSWPRWETLSNQITSTEYGKALQDMSQTEGQNNVKNATDYLSAHGGTETLSGLDMAKRILENDSNKDSDRKKVVVLFTDGETDSNPGDVVNKAHEIKNKYDATIYTVGIFDGANGSLSTHDNKLTNSNTLMHAISSNYPKATFTGNRYDSGSSNPDLSEGESYYLSADNADDLVAAFESISEQVGSTPINLGAETIIRDIVSEQFSPPSSAGSITVQSFKATGIVGGNYSWKESPDNIEYSVKTNDGTIDVTGFDFKRNYVAVPGRSENDSSEPGDFFGRKLVIKFNVREKEGFWGGNNVPTNDPKSGIYVKNENKELVNKATFPLPTVNVPISGNLSAVDQNIYLNNSVPLVEELATNSLNLPEDSWKIAYVDIEGPKLSDENLVISNKEDTLDIGVEIKVKPKYNGLNSGAGISNEASGIVKSTTSNVYVFKPELTFKDSTVYYGASAPDYKNENIIKTEWKNDNAESEFSKILGSDPLVGPNPEIRLDYLIPDLRIVSGKIHTKEDIPVIVKASTKDGDDLTDYFSFIHHPCDNGCNYDPEEGNQFLIHVKTLQLTIIKTGGNKGEPYAFKIFKDGLEYSAATIVGNSSVTIFELPIGDYTIKEDMDWSWRFEELDDMQVNLSERNQNGEVAVANTLDVKKKKWLNGYSSVVANIFGNTR